MLQLPCKTRPFPNDNCCRSYNLPLSPYPAAIDTPKDFSRIYFRKSHGISFSSSLAFFPVIGISIKALIIPD